MMHSFVILHPLQLPAGRDLSGPHITKGIPGATDYSKAEYTNTQQDLPVGDVYFTYSKHDRLYGHWVSLLKSNKEYVLTFKILAQVLVGLFFSRLAIYCKQSCTIQLIKHNIHQLPSLGISWLVE
jgi:hypothetical protein